VRRVVLSRTPHRHIRSRHGSSRDSRGGVPNGVEKEFTRRHPRDWQNLVNSLDFLFQNIFTNDSTYHPPCCRPLVTDLRALFFCIFLFASRLSTTLALSPQPYHVISQASLYTDSTNHPSCLVVSVLVCLSSRKSLNPLRHAGAHELSCNPPSQVDQDACNHRIRRGGPCLPIVAYIAHGCQAPFYTSQTPLLYHMCYSPTV
jgi:hypothetical protein